LDVTFPIQGATAISTLGLQGLNISDHPATGAFPTFNFSDDPGNYSVIGRTKQAPRNLRLFNLPIISSGLKANTP